MAISKEAYENKKRYISQYEKNHYKKMIFKVRLNGDEDILEFFKRATKTNTTSNIIRDAIRLYMKQEKKD
jgi:uncharacterized protein (DUF4415 family)